MTKGVILSCMRPTGRLHLGHYSVLENWVKMQEDFECYYAVADWHALTTSFDNTENIRTNIKEMTLDWLTAGVDPEKATIFVQSDIKEHAELHLLLSMCMPLGWLERVPTYKDQVRQFSNAGKDITTYGFLGYPLLMAADILAYRSTAVPVGEDQLPHLELAREVARRFNHLYDEVFPEPQAVLAKVKLLPGIDNRKMSKSYNNYIALAASTDEIRDRVKQMITDPARIKKDDPGNPDICAVCTYHGFYNQDEVEQIKEDCRKGCIGCVACKKRLAAVLDDFMAPLRERREKFSQNPAMIDEILDAGAVKARATAAETLKMTREAMKLR